MKSNVIQLHNINPEEFKNEILSGLKKELQEFYKEIEANKEATYLTRKEVSALLGVSLVTINEWNKKGILNPMRIGNRVRYNKSEIETILESSKQK